MRFNRRRPVGIALLSWGAGLVHVACSTSTPAPDGELIVAVETDMGVPGAMDQVDIEVYGADQQVQFRNVATVGTGSTDITLPATLGVVSQTDSTAPITIRVFGAKGGTVRVMREAITTIPLHRTALLRMSLQWLCLNTTTGMVGVTTTTFTSQCDTGFTCNDGQCQSSTVDSSVLQTYDPGQVFGGGDSSGTSACFDTVMCFASGGPATPDASCTIAKPQGASDTNINVALVVKLGEGGICAPNGCFVPLDQGPEGWSVNAAGRIALPAAVCSGITKGTIQTVNVTAACPTKQPSNPACGPWSPVADGSAPMTDGVAPGDTGVDDCAGVVCTSPPLCKDAAGTCAAGQCLYTTSANGTDCGGGMKCSGGACVPASEVGVCPGNCATAPAECRVEPGKCGTDNTCSFDTAADGASCNSGAGTCMAGKCTAITNCPGGCNGAAVCHDALCVTNQCSYPNSGSGTACAGGLGACDGNGFCQLPDSGSNDSGTNDSGSGSDDSGITDAGMDACAACVPATACNMLTSCSPCMYSAINQGLACPGGTCNGGICMPDSGGISDSGVETSIDSSFGDGGS